MVRADAIVSNVWRANSRATPTSHLGLPAPSWVLLPWVWSAGCLGKPLGLRGVQECFRPGLWTELKCGASRNRADPLPLSSSLAQKEGPLSFYPALNTSTATLPFISPMEVGKGLSRRYHLRLALKKQVSRVSSPQPRTPVLHSAFILHIPPLVLNSNIIIQRLFQSNLHNSLHRKILLSCFTDKETETQIG